MQLRHSPQDLRSQIPERRNLSVLFSDLRGFTALSETLDPEAVRELVNAYLSTSLEALRMNQLCLDKIVGDSIMALSGAPDFYPDHAFRAVKCALEQQNLLAHLRRERKREGRPLPECGIGIHSGEV
ncbi:MAG: adenylate/guanylate cyclase domain-containing protein, partial [Spirochaetia bacterium]|nr:adenylate/guanylate cyclase domain-containing protein [Spirochaetia bacterium]